MPGRQIKGLTTEIAVAGQLRPGWKDDRDSRPQQDGNWRFTTSSAEVAQGLVDLYGGRWEDWYFKRGTYVVHTETPDVEVWFPFKNPGPNSIEPVADRARSVLEGPIWRQWNHSKKLYDRECDGFTNIVSDKFGVPKETPCACNADRPAGVPGPGDDEDPGEYDPFEGGAGDEYAADPSMERWRTCKLHSQLRFYLPDVPFHGIWTCKSSGARAAKQWGPQLLGLAQYQTTDEAQAELTLVPQEGYVGGEKKNWYDIAIRSKVTLAGLMAGERPRIIEVTAGQTAAGALEAGDEPEAEDNPLASLAAGDTGTAPPPHGSVVSLDDEIADGEIVEDEDDEIAEPDPLTRDGFSATCGEVGLSAADAMKMIRAYLRGQGEKIGNANFDSVVASHRHVMLAAVDAMRAGSHPSGKALEELVGVPS